MSAVTIENLRDAIKEMNMEHSIDEPLVEEKCLALCKRYPQSAKDLIIRMEAFLMNNQNEKLSLHLMGNFEKVVSQEYKKTAPSPAKSNLGKRPAPNYATPTPNKLVSTEKGLKNDFSKLPNKSLEVSFEQANVPCSKYEQRTNQGQEVLSMNPHLSSRGPFQPSDLKPIPSRCTLTTDVEDMKNVDKRFRHMFTSLDERARALERHLLHLQKEMCNRLDLTEESLQPVGIPSQDTVWVCGRVCCEAAEGKINKSSVLLEGSRELSGGRRVRLDLADLQSFSLFPGQIVLVEGICSNGRKMAVQRIVEGAQRPCPRSDPKQLLEFHHSTIYQGGDAISVMTAAGPFTTADNLEYKPLEEFLGLAVLKEPDVLILVGPFVDSSQPLIAAADIEIPIFSECEQVGTHLASFEMIFTGNLVHAIDEFFDESAPHCATKIVLVPSLLDAHHEFVFPQPPFGDRDRVDSGFFKEPLGILNIPFSEESDPKRRVYTMPNPCMFRINEVLFGVGSNDVLFSLSSDEASQGLAGNRLTRLATHLLQQQSFCPQFPVPPNVPAQLDLRHAKHWEFQKSPDVLILPSRLTSFAKDIQLPSTESSSPGNAEPSGFDSSLIINPGQLTKGTGGGTFAELHINPISKDTLVEAVENKTDLMAHGVGARTKVAVIRI